ncbi:MAG: hypothetical protein WDN24_06770 [Sphingomonas sp.]
MAQMLPQLIEVMRQAGTADPQALQLAMMTNMGAFNALSWLMNAVTYFVGAVLLCAAFRAVLRPRAASRRCGWAGTSSALS